jgi:hypothetical protein
MWKYINPSRTDVCLNYVWNPVSASQRAEAVSIVTTSHSVVFEEIMGACFDNRTKHIDTVWQSVVFNVCKSVHHHKIQINHQLDATISPVYYSTFIYSSTCFGSPYAHHQELNNCSSSFWFYLRSVVIAVLLVVVGPVITGPTTTNSTAVTKLRR